MEDFRSFYTLALFLPIICTETKTMLSPIA
jgi:hypothetical protein